MTNIQLKFTYPGVRMNQTDTEADGKRIENMESCQEGTRKGLGQQLHGHYANSG